MIRTDLNHAIVRWELLKELVGGTNKRYSDREFSGFEGSGGSMGKSRKEGARYGNGKCLHF